MLLKQKYLRFSMLDYSFCKLFNNIIIPHVPRKKGGFFFITNKCTNVVWSKMNILNIFFGAFHFKLNIITRKKNH